MATCEPRIFDPIGDGQPVFLGCSIVANDGVSCRLGYNEDQSSLTVSLVQDTCPPVSGTKICYDLQTKAVLGADINLDAYNFTAADPGFTYPVPGSPVHFRLGEHFKFDGLVQSYTEKKNTSAYPIFSVTIVDPREILEGCQVIMGSYVGGIYATPNVFNVYALMERLGTNCGEAFLTDLTGPGRFGGAQTNEFGMPWNKVRSGLTFLTAGFPAQAGVWSDAGRIQFAGYEYVLDISELPPVANYRFSADSLSIAEIIREITTFLAMDYYVSLEHVMHGEDVIRVIKVRTVSRRQIPNLNSISNFIGNSDGVISSEKGFELRNENTSSILVGGPRIDLFVQVSNHEQVAQPRLYTESACIRTDLFTREAPVLRAGSPWHEMTIAPYWGLKPDGGVIIGQGLGMQHNFTVDTSGFNIGSKDGKRRLLTYNISVEELHAALAGKDLWLSYVAAAKPEVAFQLGLDDSPIDFLSVLGDAIINVQNPKKQQGIKPQDFVSIKKKSQQLFDRWYNALNNQQRIQFNIDTLFRIVEHYGNTYYGRQFMVRMFDLSTNNNFVCVKQDPISGRINYSKEIADAGWTDYTDGFMGLASQAYLDRFRAENDRIQAFVRFNQAQDILVPELNGEDFVFQDLGHIDTRHDFNIFNDAFEDQINFNLSQTLYIKCQLEPEFVFPTVGCGRRDYSDPRVVLSLPTILRHKNASLFDDIPYFLQFLYRGLGGIRDADNFLQAPDAEKTQIIRDILAKAGGSDVHAGVDMLRLAPNAACIPLKSNISTYGPWFANVDGVQGKTAYRVDDSLVPWNYGDTVSMSNAATLLVTESLSVMQQSERGSVSVPGLPALQLGDELESGGASLNATRALLVSPEQVENTAFSSARLESDGWTGLYGPNVTEIDIQINSQGITTDYTMRTYTPSLSRNKYFAERIKNRGILAQQNRRFQRGTFERKEDLRQVVTDITNQLIRERQEQKGIFTKSPHTVLVGQNLEYTIEEGEYGATDEQTFIRPVVQTQNLMESKSELVDYQNKHYMSLEGLLRPITIDWQAPTGTQESKAATAFPPVRGSDGKSLKWDKFTLNPLINLGAKTPGKPLSPNNCGHDIEYIARDEELLNALNIRNNDEYGESYRLFGFRGPMMLHGWGADINGKPVPNESEDPDYEGEGKSDKFCKNWLRRSNMWKTGPIDLRWDESRGVWTTPPTYSLIQARMCNDVSEVFGATGTAVWINYPEEAAPQTENTENEEGEESDGNCPGPKIIVYNTTSVPVRRGASIICYYYAQEDNYWILEAPDPIYAVYIPDNISPRSSSSEFLSGIGYLYDNTIRSFNAHIEPGTGSINVFTLNQPIRKDTDAICYERKLNEFWVIKAEHRPLCVVSDVNCEDVYTPGGTQTSLVVTDTTIWLESNWTALNDGSNPTGGCTTNPAPFDFIGYEPNG